LSLEILEQNKPLSVTSPGCFYYVSIRPKIVFIYKSVKAGGLSYFSELARDALHRSGRYQVIGGIISPVSDAYNKKVGQALNAGGLM